MRPTQAVSFNGVLNVSKLDIAFFDFLDITSLQFIVFNNRIVLINFNVNLHDL
jgi:hypothetical protein